MSSDFSNTALSEETAKKFLKANSTKDVNKILAGHPDFADEDNWLAYGGAEKNWDRVNVQTSEPFGALTELIINSIDAILMRKAVENDVKLDSPEAPQNMAEAVNQFFDGVIEGRLSSLTKKERADIAEKSVVIGVKRPTKKSRFPNYTIVDYGEGQNHKCFRKTFLSLGEKNKEGIPFVQGRFNMGSTGSIVFCTRSEIKQGMYKLILSKRALKDSDGFWGWTLIRVRQPVGKEVLPVVEYFCPNKVIPHFKTNFIRPFLEDVDLGEVRDGGSIVKLYEYDTADRSINLGLYNGLTTNLIECALPLRLYEFDAEPQPDRGALRARGINTATFPGMKIIITGNEKEDVVSDEEDDAYSLSSVNGDIQCSEDPDLGDIKIFYDGLERMKKYLKNQPYRFFYTINGQTQAKERASFLSRANLDDLRNHLIVQVDCNQMDATARASIFKPDRERMSDNRFSRKLRALIAEKLRDDPGLRGFARKIRTQRVEKTISKEEKNVLEELAKNSNELKELFGMGDQFPDSTPVSGGEDKFIGKRFPTYLRLIGRNNNSIRELPINSYRRIECETDVENGYLSRDADRGTLLHPDASELPNSCQLRNGRLRIKIAPPRGARVGDEISVQFGFDDNNPEHPDPITCNLKVKIAESEKRQQNPSGDTTGVSNRERLTKNFPEIILIEKDGWDDFDFDDESGGCVRRQEDNFIIYVNQDNKYLDRLLVSEPDEGRRELIQNRFRLGVGILTLAMYKRMIYDEDQKQRQDVAEGVGEKAVSLASSAVAAYIVTLIEKLGEGR